MITSRLERRENLIFGTICVVLLLAAFGLGVAVGLGLKLTWENVMLTAIAIAAALILLAGAGYVGFRYGKKIQERADKAIAAVRD